MKINLFVPKIPQKESQSNGVTVDYLKKSAENHGHTLNVFDMSQCKMIFGKNPYILIDGKRPRLKTLLVRVGSYSKLVELQSMIIRQFEFMGVHTINSFDATMIAKNKIRQLQMLSQYRIAMPKTMVVHSSLFVKEVAKTIGSFPVIIKKPFGSQGVGVVLVESKRGLRSLLDMMTDTEENLSGSVIVQEYIREAKGKDIRIFVVGNKIVTAMDRIAVQRDEFRSNFSLGGKVRVAELTSQEKRLALRATAALGLDIAGVDIVRSKKGAQVLEVNANPGLKGITEATGKDVAGEIIKYYVSIASVY